MTGVSHVSNVWAKTTDLQVVSGHGCRVVDVDGVEYLDFTAGIAAASTGHSHPEVVRAISEQAARFIHAQQNVYTHDLLEPLGSRLAEITPESIETFFFASSSDEVLEIAVKVAEHHDGTPVDHRVRRSVPRPDDLTMAMSTSRAIDHAGYGPFPAGVFVAPFPIRTPRIRKRRSPRHCVGSIGSSPPRWCRRKWRRSSSNP